MTIIKKRGRLLNGERIVLFISTFNAAEIMKKKIYFAGSIRGGRNFADLYRKMIEHMQLTDIVLTEHIGQADINLMKKAG